MKKGREHKARARGAARWPGAHGAGEAHLGTGARGRGHSSHVQQRFGACARAPAV